MPPLADDRHGREDEVETETMQPFVSIVIDAA